jgi:hypothetical protein
MTYPDPLAEVPQPIRDATAALMDAVADSDYFEVNVNVLVWRGALPTFDDTPRRDAVEVKLTVRPRAHPEPIILNIVPTIPAAEVEDPLGDTPSGR